MNTTTTVELTASAAFGRAGQYIARITGRDAKFTFAREFVGHKVGKRGDTTEYTVREPGLYAEGSADKSGGKSETYYIVYNCPGVGLYKTSVAQGDMLALAQTVAQGSDAEIARAALEVRLRYGQSSLRVQPDGECTLRQAQLGLPAGKVKHSAFCAALESALVAK